MGVCEKRDEKRIEEATQRERERLFFGFLFFFFCLPFLFFLDPKRKISIFRTPLYNLSVRLTHLERWRVTLKKNFFSFSFSFSSISSFPT